MSSPSPEQDRDHIHEDGFYVFFFAHTFKMNPAGGVVFDVWMHSTFAHTLIEAKQKLMEAASKFGHVEEIILHPTNVSMQFFACHWLDAEMDRVFGEEEYIPTFKEEDVLLKTEIEHRREVTKNALMKRIIDGKNAELLQESHGVLTPEEMQYLHDKITTK